LERRYRIAVIVGSLRKASYSRKLAKTLIALAPESLAMEIVEIGQLSLYNFDLEEDLPKEWVDFRAHLKDFDGVLFVTPEYNRSVPAVLKNAVDIGSRPVKDNAWNGKPGAVVSVTPGALGAFGANHHLRQSLEAVNVPIMPTPEAYIAGVTKMFNEEGELIADTTRDFLKRFIDAYAVWVARFG
jgi:chromate reductase